MTELNDARGVSATGTRRDAALDAQMAALGGINTVKTALQIGELTGDVVGALLRHLDGAAQRFEAAPGPLTRQAIANDLLEGYRFLRELEMTSSRGSDDTLLKAVKAAGQTVRIPWTPDRAKRLEDIQSAELRRPLFGAAQMDRWLAAVSYRPPSPPGPRGRGATRAPSTPFDSTQVHPYNLTLVQGSGSNAVRQTLPWPLPSLVIPNAYRIELLKKEGMSFLSRDGRIQVLAYLLEVVAETDGLGRVYDEGSGEWVEPETRATFIVENASVFGRVLFEGPEATFRVFERAPVGEEFPFVITDTLIEILWHYTKIRDKFRRKDEAPQAQGCASIQWITELLEDVPHRHKQLWVQNRLMSDRGEYPGNLRPGMLVPAEYFMTEKVAEALGGQNHLVAFIGSYTENDRIIMTEDGRVWLVKEHERNLQAYCEAVVQLEGLLALSFIIVSALGAVLGGPLASFLITAGDVAIQVNEAGGIRAFLKDLKNHPGKAAWFMLDLVSMVGDAKALKRLWMNPRQTLEASIKAADAAATAGRALLPGAAGDVATIPQPTGTLDAPSTLALHPAAGPPPVAAEAAAAGRAAPSAPHPAPAHPPPARSAPPPEPRAATGQPERPSTGRPAADERAADKALPPLEGAAVPPATAKPPKEKQIELIGDAASAAPPRKAKAPKTAKKPSNPRTPRGKTTKRADGGVRDVRRRKPKGGGERIRGKPKGAAPRTVGAHPIRTAVRMGKTATKPGTALQKLLSRSKPSQAAVERLERMNAAVLAADIAEEFADHVADGRKMLRRVAALADEEIEGLVAVRKALKKEFASEGADIDWMTLMDFPASPRGELLKLIARVEPLVDRGLTAAIANAIQAHEGRFIGGLGHFHAAAHLADRYRGQGAQIIMEEATAAGEWIREVDIQVVVGGRTIDFEVKTFINSLEIRDHFRFQMMKDLTKHIDDGWRDMRFLFSDNVAGRLVEARRALWETFWDPRFVSRLRRRGINPMDAKAMLEARMNDVADPLIDVFHYTDVD